MLCLLAACVTSGITAAADRLPVTRYSPADGLGHFAVNHIVSDARGLLWFGTREGLSKFDGYDFRTFTAADGLPSPHITDIVELPDGRYWIGTLEGLTLFDPRAPAPGTWFSNVAHPNSRAAAITRLAPDASGTLWIGTSGGLYRIRDADHPIPEPVDLGIPDQFNFRLVRALMMGRDGTLWVATSHGLYLLSADGRVQPLLSPPESGALVNALHEDREGRIWMAALDGVWRVATTPDGPRLSLVHLPGSPGETANRLLETSDGTLWVGSHHGLWRAQGEALAAGRFTRLDVTEGAPLTRITALAEDAAGHLWVGTAYGGAARVPRTTVTDVAQDIGLSSATAITTGRSGEVVFVAFRGTQWDVYCADAEGVRATNVARVLGAGTWAWNQIVHQDSRGDWWIGSGTGAYRFTGAATCADLRGRRPTDRFDRRRGLANDVVIRMFEDSRGDVWIATVGHGERSDGLSRWERATGRLRDYGGVEGLPSFERYFVSAFAEDRRGNLWIGFSHDAGLVRLRNGRFEHYARPHGLPAGQVRHMAVDAHGRLWIASFRAGVTLVDDPGAEAPRFRTFRTSDGLSSNETHAVIPDPDGRVYVASARGIDRFDPATGLVRHFTQADGLPPAEFNAGIRDRSGGLWFTHYGGVFRFVPATASARRSPGVLITAVAINGEPQPVSPVGQTALPPMRFHHRQNSLEVAFVALGATRPGDFVYRYLLETGGADWSAFSTARSVHFANLAPGRYRLLVEARDSEGRYEAPATMAFEIIPPFWQRGWFLGAIVLASGAAAYGLHRYRLRQLLAIAQIRNRIAADLHDDLGANLTKIAVLGEVARHREERSEGAMLSIAGIARESIATMGDIVWAIDPARDSLEDLVRKMRQHASETFAMGEAGLTFDAPRQIDTRHLGIELRHDLFLLFKEAVNNAARHAKASRVVVRLDIDRRHLRLRVEDDGAGFNPGAVGEGHGVQNMRNRATRMGGDLDITSRRGGGTVVLVTVPLR